MNNMAMYTISEGDLGNSWRMDILFLLFQMAQAKPANTKRVNLIGRGPLPNSQVSDSSLTEHG
jgi:hypothetical protein